MTPQQNKSIPTLVRAALACSALATVPTLWCLYETTALSMTSFFTFGIPLYGLGALLYLFEVFRDLRRHEVL
jgi:predicted membrane channel-forming protein YqfA (hemolysin III family)